MNDDQLLNKVREKNETLVVEKLTNCWKIKLLGTSGKKTI